MSQNTEYYPFAPSSSNHKRILAQPQAFLPASSPFNAPSSTLSSAHDELPSPQSLPSPIASDVCVSNQNGVRNASATTHAKDNGLSNGNHSHDKYAFTLDLGPSGNKTRREQNRRSPSQFYPSDMTSNDQEDLHSPFELDVPICEHHRLKKIQNEFLINRMLKDDENSSSNSFHRPSNPSTYPTVLNHVSPLITPSSDHGDIDALSDAGTYIIEDDGDIARDDEPEQDIIQPIDHKEQGALISSPFRRYATKQRHRHGTFDIHGVSSPSASIVNRPVVDLNVPTHDLVSPLSSLSSTHSSSSSSSLLSLPTESEHSVRREPEGASHHINDDKSFDGLVYARKRPNTLMQQKRPITPPQTHVKPAECFVISPTLEAKPFPNTPNAPHRRKGELPWKPKSARTPTVTKDMNGDFQSKSSPVSSPQLTRANQRDLDGYSFRLQQSVHQRDASPSMSNNPSLLQHSDYNSPPVRTSLRTQTTPQEPINASSPFQRNSSIRQTMPASVQYQRTLSLSTANKYPDEPDDPLALHPSLTKVYMNKSFALRRQRSNLVPSTTKPIQQQQQPQLQQQITAKQLAQRQLLKSATPAGPSTPITPSNSNGGQTNRAVELRRARAQAKIEELAQRTRQQLQKTEQYSDVMSTSWHSNASNSSKKDLFHLRAYPRPVNQTVSSQKQDMLKTRTISSSSHHRSSSASPNPSGERGTPPRYRKAMVSSVTDERQYQKMHGSAYSEGERCDSLRDNGQRLAIKLIQLSSGILAKLKPNNVVLDDNANLRELEQLVDKLQTVNRTLTTIDASLTNSTSDGNLI